MDIDILPRYQTQYQFNKKIWTAKIRYSIPNKHKKIENFIMNPNWFISDYLYQVLLM